MKDHIAILDILAAGFEGLAKVHGEHAEAAEAAEVAAADPVLTKAQARVLADTAKRHRDAAAPFEARALACRAGAEALARSETHQQYRTHGRAPSVTQCEDGRQRDASVVQPRRSPPSVVGAPPSEAT